MPIPQYYDYANNIADVNATDLTRFFHKYLLQKAVSVFKWEIPKTWNRDYFLYSLYCNGCVSVVQTDKYGVIPQHCTLMGYDVMYRPTNAVITNPLLTGILTPRIDVQCTLFKLNPDYTGIMDIVKTYGDLMAMSVQTAGINLMNCNVSYVFAAKNKAAAVSFKEMFKKIVQGEPAIVVDKALYNEDGSKAWDAFDQNVKQNYIASEILDDLRKWENLFDTEIGIPNANTNKRERLIVDEVNSNNVETATKCELWLEDLQKTCAKTHDLFGVDISVDWRYKPVEKKEDNKCSISQSEH